jgi:cell pole-organizing protein PopZ
MAKLAQAQEPSMEEILASIRRIISDEENGSKPAPAKPVAAPVALVPNPLPPVVEATAPEPESGADILELSEEEITEPEEYSLEDDVTFADPEPEPVQAPPPPPPVQRIFAVQSAPEVPAKPLLSPTVDAAVTSAFDHLSGMVLANQARTLEDLVKDMLRPMLKGWLDANLPGMVERLVRDEIERVARRR